MNIFTTTTIAVLGCCLILYASLNITRALFKPYKISYSFDSFLAPATRDRLKTIIIKELTTSSAPDLLLHIQLAIPAITTVCIYRRRPWHTHVQLKAAYPIVTVNEHLALTNKGTIAPCYLFIEQSMKGLPRITINEQTLLKYKTDATELYNFIDTLPIKLKEDYDIIWHDKTHIVLVNKSQSHHLVCTSHTHFDTKLQHALNNIDHVIQQRLAAKKKKRIWQTDVRFNGFMVLSSTLGEKYENSIA